MFLSTTEAGELTFVHSPGNAAFDASDEEIGLAAGAAGGICQISDLNDDFLCSGNSRDGQGNFVCRSVNGVLGDHSQSHIRSGTITTRFLADTSVGEQLSSLYLADLAKISAERYWQSHR